MRKEYNLWPRLSRVKKHYCPAQCHWHVRFESWRYGWASRISNIEGFKSLRIRNLDGSHYSAVWLGKRIRKDSDLMKIVRQDSAYSIRTRLKYTRPVYYYVSPICNWRTRSSKLQAPQPYTHTLVYENDFQIFFVEEYRFILRYWWSVILLMELPRRRLPLMYFGPLICVVNYANLPRNSALWTQMIDN